MQPHTKSLRVGRTSLPNQLYLITTVTEMRASTFADFETALAVARSIHAGAAAPSRLWCWVLMPDHWHGVVELDETDTLASMMRRFKARTAKATNQSRQSAARVWQKGYHDHALRATEELLGVARYVVANPVRAGIVRRIRDHPFWDAAWI